MQTSLFAFPLGAVQFTVFGNMKKVITNVAGSATGGVKGTAVAIASSACASLASCAVGVPQEILKQRLVTNIYPNFQTAVSTIFKTEGFKGFTGWVPTVARKPALCGDCRSPHSTTGRRRSSRRREVPVSILKPH